MRKTSRTKLSRRCGFVLLKSCASWLVVLAVSASAKAQTFVLPPSDVDLIGALQTVQARYEDTLADLARFYDVGHDEIVRANPGVDTWLPGKGTDVLIPSRFILPDAKRQGIVVNLPEMRLYYFEKPGAGGLPLVTTYPVSVGRQEWRTPEGGTKVIAKKKNPTWTPPESIRKEAREDGRELPRVVPAGPDNPLGDYAIRLGLPGYLIHGTNRPYGVGMRVTHGCLRMYPEDIEKLFPTVPLNTKVFLLNQPVKVALHGEDVWVEVHPSLEEDTRTAEELLAEVSKQALKLTGWETSKLDPEQLKKVMAEASGVPTLIAQMKPETGDVEAEQGSSEAVTSRESDTDLDVDQGLGES